MRLVLERIPSKDPFSASLTSSLLSAHAPEFVPSSSKLNYTSASTASKPIFRAASLGPPVEVYSAFYVNVCSLRNSLAELHLKLYTDKFNVLCFTETWLCSKFTNGMLDPQSQFNLYRRDRPSVWPGGGVLIFIHKSLQSSLHSIDGSCFPNSESIAAHIHLASGLKICIACVYLPPNMSIEIFHENLLYLKRICLLKKLLILAGDFNLPDAGIWSRARIQRVRSSLICAQATA